MLCNAYILFFQSYPKHSQPLIGIAAAHIFNKLYFLVRMRIGVEVGLARFLLQGIYIPRYVSFSPIIYPLIYPLPCLFVSDSGICYAVVEGIVHYCLLKFEVLRYTFHSERVSYFVFLCN